MKKICILIPFYGKWPSFLPLYLKSCSYNTEISFLFFTDLKPPSEYPSNVFFHSFKFSKIKDTLDDLLGFDTSITTPYKLCDVRPAYGLIFKEYITDFEFWGWGDMDLVYGKINDYVSTEMLQECDVISFRKKWISGSLCFLRNNQFLTHLFLEAENLKAIFSTPDYMGFDEISKCWHLIRNVDFDTIRWTSDNFTRLLRNAENERLIRLRFDDLAKESIPSGDFLIWDRGRLQDSKMRNYSHYHFITEKGKPYFIIPQVDVVSEKYYVDSTGFYSEKEFELHLWIRNLRIAKAIPKLFFNYASRILIALKRKALIKK